MEGHCQEVCRSVWEQAVLHYNVQEYRHVVPFKLKPCQPCTNNIVFDSTLGIGGVDVLVAVGLV